ncbi:MAG: hypothetical protein ACLUFF_00215 [Acutalibacteraceae bacterium]
MQKLWPEKGAATSRPPPRCFGDELCGADFSFLIKRQCWDRVKKVRGKAFVSGRVLAEG